MNILNQKMYVYFRFKMFQQFKLEIIHNDHNIILIYFCYKDYENIQVIT